MHSGRTLSLILPLLALFIAAQALANSGAPIPQQTQPIPTATPHQRPGAANTDTVDLITLLQPTPTPTLAPGEVRPRVYRLEQFDTNQAIYFLTLNSDGTASVATRRQGTSPIVTIAEGTWINIINDGSEVEVTLTSSRFGIALERANVITLSFVDGFPSVTSFGNGTLVSQMGETVFSLGSGDTNSLVGELNQLLAAIPWLGFIIPADAPDTFTQETRLAVVRFQRVQGLLPSGSVGLLTWIALQDPDQVMPAPTPTPAPATATPLPTATPEPVIEPTATTPPPAPVSNSADMGYPDIDALPNHDANGNPIIYLTFDDGPQPGSTQPILDLLAQYGAKATFFNIGQNVSYHPELVRAVVSAGHYVGDHTWDHASLAGMTPEQFLSEVEDTRDALIAAAGDLMTLDGTVRLLRPPYGATDENTRALAHERGYAVVLWTIDPQDWRRPGADAIANHVITNAYPGAIVLMHDGGGDRSQTVAALGNILPALQQAGYIMKTIFLP